MRAVTTSILLVDDNTTFLNAVKGALCQLDGVRVVGCASDGIEALQMIGTLHPDLVLLDLSMPLMGGLEVAGQLKGQASAPDIIMLSMHDSDDYRHAAADAGVRAFVKKDNVMSELMPLISQLKSYRRAHHLEREKP